MKLEPIAEVVAVNAPPMVNDVSPDIALRVTVPVAVKLVTPIVVAFNVPVVVAFVTVNDPSVPRPVMLG